MSASTLHILDRLRRRAADAPDTIALREIAGDRVMSWSDLYLEVCEFAAGLKSDLPTDAVVMLRCPNTCDFHVAFLAVLAAGMTAFPVSHEIARPEFEAAALKAS